MTGKCSRTGTPSFLSRSTDRCLRSMASLEGSLALSSSILALRSSGVWLHSECGKQDKDESAGSFKSIHWKWTCILSERYRSPARRRVECRIETPVVRRCVRWSDWFGRALSPVHSVQDHGSEFLESHKTVLRLAVHFRHDGSQIPAARNQHSKSFRVKAPCVRQERLDASGCKCVEQRNADSRDFVSCHT